VSERYLEDYRLGEVIRASGVTLTEGTIVRYALSSGS
jgi:hypothetical protein